MTEIVDPYRMFKMLWPHEHLYDREVEILYSIEEAAETYVQAGNKLGKDYITGRAVDLFFLRHVFIGKPPNRGCRIVVISASDRHLDVLFGEMYAAIRSAAHPLDASRGGPFILKDREMRVIIDGAEDPISYVKGMVYKQGTEAETLSGHHARFTLAVGDEASGILTPAYKAFQGWAKRMLFIGNPNPCDNFYKVGCKAGDLLVA